MFEKQLVAGWGDMDFNSHMRNTAFLDKSADVRMMFFSENGFPMEEFIRRKIGPVIRRDEIEYFKEVRLLEEVRMHADNRRTRRRRQSLSHAKRVLASRSDIDSKSHQRGWMARSIEPKAGCPARCLNGSFTFTPTD